jgi:1,4-dihydroxy-2-naphthoyl-CoA synthase
MPDLVKRQDSGHVARLTLNDPANVNALSLEMIETLIAAFRDIQADGRIRAVIVAADHGLGSDERVTAFLPVAAYSCTRAMAASRRSRANCA